MRSSATSPGPLPGAEIVTAGLAELEAGRDIANAAAVLMAARRLRATGVDVSPRRRDAGRDDGSRGRARENSAG